MKRKVSNQKRRNDHYSKQAKKDRFPARSVYKLQEIQRRFKVIRKGDRGLDLGCSPGSWLLYAAELVGKDGYVTGIDLEPLKIKIPSNINVYTADIFSLDDDLRALVGKNFNAVMSDMAPATTGQKGMDAARSFHLCMAALTLAREVMVHGGNFVCKIFQGEEFEEFLDSVKDEFRNHKIFKPRSSRKASKEIYVIGKGKK